MSVCKLTQRCKVGNCNERHTELLHDAYVAGVTLHIFGGAANPLSETLLLNMNIGADGYHEPVRVLWDSASTISLIILNRAKDLKFHGKSVNLTVSKTGGFVEELKSCEYT